MRWSTWPAHWRRTFGALMVMPRSRSRSIESRYWARMSLGSTAPVSSRNRSASVDFPWSTWLMIAMARWDSSGSIVPILTHRGIGSGTVPCYPDPVPDRNDGSRDAHGEHQEPDQAEPPERAAAHAQQGRALRAQDPRQAGGRGP